MTRSKAILIVDDDPILVEVLKAYFQERGASDCVTAPDGRTAVQLIDAMETEFALITCDINMPDCDGIEFLKLLKERSRGDPILMITSASDTIAKSAEIFAKSYGLNFLGLIRKPIRPADLDAALSSIKFD